VHRKADDADKKLGKMGSEHKHLQMQTDLLNKLNGEIRAIDGEIMSEEAALADFKRSTIRVVMGLKFGGLVECCEKGVVRLFSSFFFLFFERWIGIDCR
jgi:hypothetical protein